MLGKTHYRLGILYYVVFTIIPVLTIIPFLQTKEEIIFAGIITEGFGSLLPDAEDGENIVR